MRSTWSSGMASSAVAPTDDDPTRRPSINTSVWPALAPRRNAPDVAPAPPLIVTSTPGCRWSSCGRLCAPLRRISSAWMTVRSASRSEIGCGVRDCRHHDRIEHGRLGRRSGLRVRRNGGDGGGKHDETDARCVTCALRARWSCGWHDVGLRVAPCIPARHWLMGTARRYIGARTSRARGNAASTERQRPGATPPALRSPIRRAAKRRAEPGRRPVSGLSLADRLCLPTA